MSTVIRLDASALNTLFPEGTQARLELQNHVLCTVAKQFVRGALTEDVKSYLTQLSKDAAAELDVPSIVHRHFTSVKDPNSQWSFMLKVDERMSSALVRAAREAFETEVEDKAEVLLKERVERYVTTLDTRLGDALTRTLNRAEKEAFETRVAQAMKEFLGEKA
ncbi:hypothetical protein D3C85_794930 [compost metagenome]